MVMRSAFFHCAFERSETAKSVFVFLMFREGLEAEDIFCVKPPGTAVRSKRRSAIRKDRIIVPHFGRGLQLIISRGTHDPLPKRAELTGDRLTKAFGDDAERMIVRERQGDGVKRFA